MSRFPALEESKGILSGLLLRLKLPSAARMIYISTDRGDVFNLSITVSPPWQNPRIMIM